MKIRLTENADCANVGGFINWRRLVQQLERAGEFRRDETVVRLEVDERGVQYFVEQS